MPQTQGPATQQPLSRLYHDKALKEFDELPRPSRKLLTVFREQDWDDAVVFAFIEMIRRKVVRQTSQDPKYKGDLAGRLGVTTSALDHWFKDGEIRGAKVLRLMSQPEFAGALPSADETRAHQMRLAIPWLRRHVLLDRGFRGAMRWDTLLFVAVAHRMETEDPNEQFEKCPDTLKKEYGTRKDKWTAGKLLDEMAAWGKAYRLYCLEIEKRGQW